MSFLYPPSRNEVNVDRDEFIAREKTRGDCYRFLAACFYQPEHEVLFGESLLKNLDASIALISPEAALFSGKLAHAASRYSDEDLRAEYARLFVGPHDLKAPPYGSVYLDAGRRVMGDSTLEVMKWYSREGLTVDGDFNELPDHIAAELEFMYYLVYKETEAWERSERERAMQFISTQDEFLRTVLGQWVQPFCSAINEHTDNEWFTALADCAAAFVMHEHAQDHIPAPQRPMVARA